MDALTEPLDSSRPLTEVLLAAVTEDAEGDIALAQLLPSPTNPEHLRRFIREAEEKAGALSLAISAAKSQLYALENIQ